MRNSPRPDCSAEKLSRKTEYAKDFDPDMETSVKDTQSECNHVPERIVAAVETLQTITKRYPINSPDVGFGVKAAALAAVIAAQTMEYENFILIT